MLDVIMGTRLSMMTCAKRYTVSVSRPQDADIIYVVILVAPEAHLAFILELPEPPAGPLGPK